MARVKAIFDADILIHLVKTNSLELSLVLLDTIYVSEYVYQHEIKKDTPEGRLIEKIKNSRKIKILEYNNLTEVQRRIYKETYKLLKKEEISSNPNDNPVNEGERITACFAKACNIYYYMSDDNRASHYIKSLAAVDVVNFCDILFIYLYVFGKNAQQILRMCYKCFINLYDEDKIPRIIKQNGKVRSFEEIMGVCYDKFHINANLNKLLNNIWENKQKESMTAADEITEK